MSEPHLVTLLDIGDGSGSRLTVEHDARDGRAYIAVTFDGHDAPFELGPESAADIAAALAAYAAPVDTSRIRFTGSDRTPVKQGKAAVKTACRACGGNGRPGGWPCGGCGRS